MTKDRIETFLAGIRAHNEACFAIVSQLRQIAMASGPASSEEIRYGGLLFSSTESFCGVFPYTNHVTVEFGQGASLTDSYGMLMGKGKGRRHIKVHSLSDIPEKHVAAYVDLALKAVGG